ncbi:MAG: 6-carboxytetrahydropterin synthase [Lachnospiraceae bacterium]|nr:6-carboxytetrahydropterin synthase [Lachnospiraceae bacterium]
MEDRSRRETRLFREYRLKFYLNANHYVIINNKKGETHPHTWEFTLNILVGRESFVEFFRFEKEIEQLFAPYQNKVMNELDPFNGIVPSLENMVEYFGNKAHERVKNTGGRLISIEGSETPTRSYIINMDGAFESRDLEAYTSQVKDEVIDTVLDDLMDFSGEDGT